MHEQLKQYYVREEEFLDHFEQAAIIAARALEGSWSPDYRCDDAVRKRRGQWMAAGQLDTLVFAGAAVFHDERDAFSSVQIALRSSARSVNIRVRRIGDVLVAQTLADRSGPAVAGS